MLKVKLPADYPPEKGRYFRGNDYSPVAVCVILDTFDFTIPTELNDLVMSGIDSGAAISGMLQTENIGMEKMICNIVANPNIRYIVLCEREAAGHLPGESLLALKQSGIDEKQNIIGSKAPTPYLSNIPLALIDRFNIQIDTIIDLLCKPGERDNTTHGLNPKVIEKAVWSCFQEEATTFMDYVLQDIGAYSEPPIIHKIVLKLDQPQHTIDTNKSSFSVGLILHKLLPQTDCKECGKKTCLAFAIDLIKGKSQLMGCPSMGQPEFSENRTALTKLLE